ncbi:hypothetical protein SAMN04487783_2302 [Agrococcus baldri]|uniref:DUF6993 domain-containing protein n=1 Tax=Agrococcus baldri TaxID=153730 RepID=A0AA94HPA2_9MICO|nr:hypothetical protein [Agrococcus baldri]SFS16500.1 hypothetical protein SAMN04487783_2302 [Agrococcus baldri]
MRPFAALALLASLVLAGCSSAPLTRGPGTEPTTGTPAASAAPRGTEAPTTDAPAPEEPEADAELDAFRAAIAGGTHADPGALVAAVEAAGFDRSAIERTREIDSLGAPVTFLEIAVRVEDGCLVGQVGAGEPLALRTAALGGGGCLVGDVIRLD